MNSSGVMFSANFVNVLNVLDAPYDGNKLPRGLVPVNPAFQPRGCWVSLTLEPIPSSIPLPEGRGVTPEAD